MKHASLITIVKNDPALEKTIAGVLAHETEVSFELLLVIKGEPKDFPTINDKRVRLVPYQNAHKQVTIPEQRNVGVREAKYDPIVFIDASCVPRPGWLDKLYAQFTAGEKIVAGFVTPEEADTINTISGRLGQAEYLEECPTANVLVSKKVFETVGEFDESFEYGSDVDLMWRARDAGFKIKNEPSAVVTHEWGSTSEQFHRAFRYGKARCQLYWKHGQRRWEYFLKKDALLFIYAPYLLFSPIGLVFPLYFLFLLVPLWKNRHAQPFLQVGLNLAFGAGILRKAVDLILQPSP